MAEVGNGRSEKFWDWLYKQGVSTVLLILIFGALCWFGHYAVTTAIPQHLQQIQDGYEKIQSGFERSQLKHSERLKDVIESYKDDQERDQRTIERLLGERQ